MKGLEALKTLSHIANYYYSDYEYEEEETIIERELKSLEIIKEMKCFTFYEIDNQYYVSGINVPKERYDLLKEVLK